MALVSRQVILQFRTYVRLVKHRRV